MKFINYLESISGVGVYPLTSLLIFFLFFVLLAIKVFQMDRNTLEEINNLPLEDEANQN